MKKVSLLLLTMLVLILGVCSVNAIDVSIDNYYPTPVEAGEYLNVWLKVSNYDSVDAKNSVIKLKQSFPFSLDPGEPEEIIIDKIEAGSFVMEKIKINVDGGAKEGDNKLTFQYADTLGGDFKEKSTSVTVVESQTTFDVVLQELNEEGVFIAIANIGKNPANAVTVRIPEQNDFKTQLVSASIVGNLESGDYTLVGFEILPKNNMPARTFDNTNEDVSLPADKNIEQADELKDLLIQVDYTDPLGIRRTVVKSIQLRASALSTTELSIGSTGFQRNGSSRTASNSTTSNSWFWISIVLIAGIVGYFTYKRIKKKKD